MQNYAKLYKTHIWCVTKTYHKNSTTWRYFYCLCSNWLYPCRIVECIVTNVLRNVIHTSVRLTNSRGSSAAQEAVPHQGSVAEKLSQNMFFHHCFTYLYLFVHCDLMICRLCQPLFVFHLSCCFMSPCKDSMKPRRSYTSHPACFTTEPIIFASFIA